MTARRPIRRPAPTAPPPKHRPANPGARDVTITESFDLSLVSVGEAIEANDLVVLKGEPGLGKTFTILTIAEGLSIRVCYLEARPSARGKSIELDMLHALGKDPDPREPRWALQDAIVDACAVKQVLILDEIDRWGYEGVDLTRYLWTPASNKTTFVFVGEKVDHLLATNRALDSRVSRRIEFKPLGLEAGVAAMRAYHPVFEHASDALMARAHALTGGRFRLIAQLLQAILLASGGPEPRLTRTMLEQAWDATGRPER